MRLPVLFLGHGSPMNAIENTPYSQAWAALGEKLKQQYGDEIKAVLAVSAHWCTDGTAITAMEQPRTIHDFGGFPQALFDMRYPAAGSKETVEKVRAVLGEANVSADEHWGLDHGTWGVLCHLFPKADIPVVQLSMNMHLDFAGHFALGQKLSVLRKQGVLIMASGNIVHNLRLMQPSSRTQPVPPYDWAVSIKDWVNARVRENDTATLTNESAYPPEMQLAAPSPDHYWPLLYAIGAADGGKAMLFNDDIVGGSLSMPSVLWH